MYLKKPTVEPRIKGSGKMKQITRNNKITIKAKTYVWDLISNNTKSVDVSFT